MAADNNAGIPRDGPGSPPRGRPFSSDNPGNRSGRPKGARNKTTIACQDLLDGEGESITRKAIELAKSGDTVALRLVIDRVLPKTRGRAIEIELPRLRVAADLVEACAAVVEAAAAGDLTLGEAREFMALLDVQRKAIESQELQVRVELLESEFGRMRR